MCLRVTAVYVCVYARVISLVCELVGRGVVLVFFFFYKLNVGGFFFYGNCVAGRTHRFFFFRCSLTSFIYGCASFSLSLSFLCVVEERFLACLGRALRGHITAEEYFCAYIHMSSLALLLLFLCFRQSLAFFFLVVSLAQNCENEGYTYIYICVFCFVLVI